MLLFGGYKVPSDCPCGDWRRHLGGEPDAGLVGVGICRRPVGGADDSPVTCDSVIWLSESGLPHESARVGVSDCLDEIKARP